MQGERKPFEVTTGRACDAMSAETRQKMIEAGINPYADNAAEQLAKHLVERIKKNSNA